MTSRAYVPFEIENKIYALEASCVAEIVGPRPYVQIPHATELIAGVFSWNGRAIPLLSLDQLLGVQGRRGRLRADDPTRRRTLIVQVEGESLGLPVDGAREVVHISISSVRQPEASVGAFVSGEIERSDGLWRVLDLELATHHVLGTQGVNAEFELTAGQAGQAGETTP